MGTWTTNTPTSVGSSAEYYANATHTATGAEISIRIREYTASDSSAVTVGDAAAEALVAALVASGEFSNVGAARVYGGAADSYTP